MRRAGLDVRAHILGQGVEARGEGNKLADKVVDVLAVLRGPSVMCRHGARVRPGRQPVDNAQTTIRTIKISRP
jgi:hypothetical protein